MLKRCRFKQTNPLPTAQLSVARRIAWRNAPRAKGTEEAKPRRDPRRNRAIRTAGSLDASSLRRKPVSEDGLP
jgi:hypothetical protein